MNNIICPKCKSTNKTDNEQECPNCGIIYKKYLHLRKNAFEDTIHTICGKGLDFSSEEFEKLSSRFPEMKKNCDQYLTAINTAKKDFSDGNYERALKIFTALRKKQPGLDQAIAPFIVKIESNMESDKEETESNSAENLDSEENGTNNVEENTTVDRNKINEKDREKRIPCPSCAERIKVEATLCPYCKQPVFSKEKGSNALLSIVYYVIGFLFFFYIISAFVDYQAEKDYDKIMQKATEDTRILFQELKN